MGHNHNPLLSLLISDCRNGLVSETVKRDIRWTIGLSHPSTPPPPLLGCDRDYYAVRKEQLKNKSSKLNRLSITLDADNPINRNVEALYGWFAITCSSKTSLLFCASRHCSSQDTQSREMFSCLSQNEAIENQSNATLLQAQLSTDLS